MSHLVEASELKKHFPVRRRFLEKGGKKFVHAVDGVNFNIEEGETLALVGESGCGKTTTGKMILRLIEPTEGSVNFMNREIFTLDHSDMLKLRRHMQMIFQDPFASLNPRKTAGQIISKPFTVHEPHLSRGEIEDKIAELLNLVGLSPPEIFKDRYPHEFSGGQRQRIGIARAIALHPKFIVADEPVSALDVSVRAQILNLLKEIQKMLNLTYLFITHDLSVVRSISNRVAVMYLGEIVESAEVKELYDNPLHPYTKAIFAATPIPDPKSSRSRKRIILKGDVPSPLDPPPGCRFHTRCWLAQPRCRKIGPEYRMVRKEHYVACHLVE